MLKTSWRWYVWEFIGTLNCMTCQRQTLNTAVRVNRSASGGIFQEVVTPKQRTTGIWSSLSSTTVRNRSAGINPIVRRTKCIGLFPVFKLCVLIQCVTRPKAINNNCTHVCSAIRFYTSVKISLQRESELGTHTINRCSIPDWASDNLLRRR